MFMFRFIQTFNEYVNYNNFYGNILKLNQVVLNLFPNEMILYIYMCLLLSLNFGFDAKVSKKCDRVFFNKTQVFK